MMVSRYNEGNGQTICRETCAAVAPGRLDQSTCGFTAALPITMLFRVSVVECIFTLLRWITHE